MQLWKKKGRLRMVALERLAWWLGYALVIVGGTELAFLLIAGIGLAACKAWISVSNRCRYICKAESLIHEYRRNREEFLRWQEIMNMMEPEG